MPTTNTYHLILFLYLFFFFSRNYRCAECDEDVGTKCEDGHPLTPFRVTFSTEDATENTTDPGCAPATSGVNLSPHRPSRAAGARGAIESIPEGVGPVIATAVDVQAPAPTVSAAAVTAAWPSTLPLDDNDKLTVVRDLRLGTDKGVSGGSAVASIEGSNSTGGVDVSSTAAAAAIISGPASVGASPLAVVSVATTTTAETVVTVGGQRLPNGVLNGAVTVAVQDEQKGYRGVVGEGKRREGGCCE